MVRAAGILKLGDGKSLLQLSSAISEVHKVRLEATAAIGAVDNVSKMLRSSSAGHGAARYCPTVRGVVMNVDHPHVGDGGRHGNSKPTYSLRVNYWLSDSS